LGSRDTARRKKTGHSRHSKMPKSHHRSSRRRLSHTGRSSYPSEGDTRTNSRDDENTRQHPRLSPTTRLDGTTAKQDSLFGSPNSRNKRRHRHYHHRNEPSRTEHKRHPTQKWEHDGHPADTEELNRGTCSSVLRGVRTFFGLDQTAIKQSWKDRGRDR